MSARKPLMVLGGLLTLVSMYVLSIYRSGALYVWGYPAIQLIPDMFMNPGAYVVSLPDLAGYLVAVLFVLFLISGVLQLLGVASRAVGVLGGVFACAGAAYFVLVLLTGTSILPLEAAAYIDLFAGVEFVPGIIPYHFPVMATVYPGTMGLGAIVLVAGGVLGLIGTAMPED